MFDSNIPGTGKGLLGDIAITIAYGHPPACVPWPKDDEEVRKKITTLAMSRDTLVKLDNVNTILGGPSLEAALTSERWKDRILSTNMSIDEPLRMIWYATGNNIALSPDMQRRVAPVRLVSQHERPENRSDFEIPKLAGHCKENRERYLSAAITIMKGFMEADPRMTLPAWGSFEGWSRLVRGAIVWLGLPDPVDARAGLVRQSNGERDGLWALLKGIHLLDENSQGVKAAEIIETIVSSPDQECSKLITQGVSDLRPNDRGLPSPGSLGKLLGRKKDCIVGNLRLTAGKRNNTTIWHVTDTSAGDEGDYGDILKPDKDTSKIGLQNELAAELSNPLTSPISRGKNEEVF